MGNLWGVDCGVYEGELVVRVFWFDVVKLGVCGDGCVYVEFDVVVLLCGLLCVGVVGDGVGVGVWL